MVRVILSHNRSGELQRVQCKGHADFAPNGQDIVCAAISALMQTTAMGLQEVAQLSISLTIRTGLLIIELPADLSEQARHDAHLLLETLRLGLQAIAREHARFLQIIERRC